jgi:hypothetical protein
MNMTLRSTDHPRCAQSLLSCALALVLGFTTNRLSADDFDPTPVVSLLELVIDADPDSAGEILRTLASKAQSGELSTERLESLQESLAPLI